ncbi:hypothetical protein OG871_40570 (plasmid) [Kitasatospora sp. NBC_00374]|uniref:hypothetical protein n=1 Tax=Kitasatospora sp. NBC_00374 TaxID=2975964 RepID=UPI002F910DA9
MHVIINAGSGPVPDTDRTTAAAAAENMTQFVADLAGLGTTVAVCTATPDGDSGDGRYAFRLDLADGRAVDVEMPGIPLDQVRYMGAAGQDIWDFPRLYVDGSSWVWRYALGACGPAED